MEFDTKKRLPFEQLMITKRKLIIYIEMLNLTLLIWTTIGNGFGPEFEPHQLAPYNSAAQQYLPQGLTNYTI